MTTKDGEHLGLRRIHSVKVSGTTLTQILYCVLPDTYKTYSLLISIHISIPAVIFISWAKTTNTKQVSSKSVH